MESVPAPSPVPPALNHLYLIVNGQPQGPFDAGQVKARLAGGIISPDTLVCPDGGSAWVRVQDFLAAEAAKIQQAPPPVSPATATPTMTFVPGQRTIAKMPRKDQTRGWELGLIIATVVLFFLPWVHFGMTTIFSQSGMQAITGELELNAMAGTAPDSEPVRLLGIIKEKGITTAPLCTAALACVTVALGAAMMKTARRLTGVAALAAAILLIVQGIRGFPVNQDFKAALKENAAAPPSPRTGIPADLVRMDRDIKNLSLILNLAPLVGKWYYVAVGAAALAGVMALLAPRAPPAE